jgi:long-chain acyl-CoA synthetase
MKKIWLKHYPPGVRAEIDPDSFASLLALFECSVQRFGPRPAFTDRGTTLTFSELDGLAGDFAAYLQKAWGIKKQDCVAIMLPNLLQFPIALLGAMRTGARITNVNPFYTATELKHQLIDAEAKAIVIHSDCTRALEQIRDDTRIEVVIIASSTDLSSAACNGSAQHPAKGVVLETALAEGRRLALDPVEIYKDDIALLQYTGGTTGISKAAVLSHRNLIANILQFSAALGPIIDEGKEIVITALPLYHIFALTGNCLAFFYLGAHNVLIADPRDSPALVAELGNWRFSVITGVNTLFNRLVNAQGFGELDFSALKIAIGGGAAIQHTVADKWFELTGCHVLATGCRKPRLY